MLACVRKHGERASSRDPAGSNARHRQEPGALGAVGPPCTALGTKQIEFVKGLLNREGSLKGMMQRRTV